MKLPIVCPSCENSLRVSQMKCDQCQTEVNGITVPLYLKLNREEQDFILEFFFWAAAVSKKWLNKLVIPILRNKMDDLIEKLKI
jgi:hypothetical protein